MKNILRWKVFLFKNAVSALLFSSLVFFVFFAGCDEALPPYKTPQVLAGGISLRYIYTAEENDFRFYATVTNVYDETFQDSALVKGSFEILLKRDQRCRRTFVISMAQYYPPGGDTASFNAYDSGTHLFTIDPGKKISFLFRWDLLDDTGRAVPFVFGVDPQCPLRNVSNIETFIVKGAIQITSHSGVVMLGPTEIDAFYALPFVDKKVCVPF